MAIGYARTSAQTGWVRLLYYTPVLSVALLPPAATVYLVTSMSWTVAQTLALRQVFG